MQTSRRPPLLAAVTAVAVLIGGECVNAQSFSGKVIDETGKPLAGSRVDYTRMPKLTLNTRGWGPRLIASKAEPAHAGSLTSQADGTFTAASLPAGDYILCVHGPSDLYADPCLWNQGKIGLAVNQTGNTVVDPVTIRAGVKIHIKISDPQGLLPAGQEVAPAVLVGVNAANGAFRPAMVASRSGNSVETVVTIPHDQVVTLWAFSRSLRFVDSNGKAMLPTQATPITPPAGASDHNMFLTVTK